MPIASQPTSGTPSADLEVNLWEWLGPSWQRLRGRSAMHDPNRLQGVRVSEGRHFDPWQHDAVI
jgi:hypothetical protein